MLRNFLRDLGTQVTLGAFVATAFCCTAVIALVSSAAVHRGGFVPHLSVTAALVLILIDVRCADLLLNHVASSSCR